MDPTKPGPDSAWKTLLHSAGVALRRFPGVRLLRSYEKGRRSEAEGFCLNYKKSPPLPHPGFTEWYKLKTSVGQAHRDRKPSA